MIIITGGAGFLGANLLAGLEAHTDEDLVICDTLGSDDKWRNISKRGLRDIIHPEHLFYYLDTHADEVSMIYHMGAVSATTETDADLVINHNFTLSRHLWKWCAENDVRFVYASSVATYGNGSQGFDDHENPEYLAKLQPLNPYGWSKHLFDRRVGSLVHGSKKDNEAVPPQWVGLKMFNIYGPNEYHKGEQVSVIGKLYPQVMAGAAARLFKSHHPDYEDGGQMRDFIWVGDCVDVMLWLYDNPKTSGIYNLGTGTARSFKDLAEATFIAAGMEPKITFIEMPQELRSRYQYFTEANMKKLRDAGYDKAFTTLEEGIQTYVKDYLGKADSYK